MKNKREKDTFKYRYTHMHTSISHTGKIKNQGEPEERMYASSVVFKSWRLPVNFQAIWQHLSVHKNYKKSDFTRPADTELSHLISGNCPHAFLCSIALQCTEFSSVDYPPMGLFLSVKNASEERNKFCPALSSTWTITWLRKQKKKISIQSFNCQATACRDCLLCGVFNHFIQNYSKAH